MRTDPDQQTVSQMPEISLTQRNSRLASRVFIGKLFTWLCMIGIPTDSPGCLCGILPHIFHYGNGELKKEGWVISFLESGSQYWVWRELGCFTSSGIKRGKKEFGYWSRFLFWKEVILMNQLGWLREEDWMRMVVLGKEWNLPWASILTYLNLISVLSSVKRRMGHDELGSLFSMYRSFWGIIKLTFLRSLMFVIAMVWCWDLSGTQLSIWTFPKVNYNFFNSYMLYKDIFKNAFSEKSVIWVDV